MLLATKIFIKQLVNTSLHKFHSNFRFKYGRSKSKVMLEENLKSKNIERQEVTLESEYEKLKEVGATG